MVQLSTVNIFRGSPKCALFCILMKINQLLTLKQGQLKKEAAHFQTRINIPSDTWGRSKDSQSYQLLLVEIAMT